MVAPADLSRKTKLIESRNEWPEWLPTGWKVELQAPKSGSPKSKKCYVDPSTGCKFYSKAQVLRFLRNMKQKSSTSKQKVTTENSTVEDLPPGWKKEIKVRKCANKSKRDRYYIDPVNGYVFSSKMDVQRYLETGDISSCAKKPTKRDIQEKSPPSSATKRQRVEHPLARDQSVGGDGVSGVGSVTSSGAYSLRNRTKSTSALTTVPTPISVEVSSRRTPRKDGTGSVEKSKNGSAPVKAEELDQNSVSKSRHQKWLDLPRWYPKRLAGDEPDTLSIVQMSPKVDKKQGDEDDSAVIVQALPKTVRPPDDETSQAVDLNSSTATRSKPGKELLDSPSDGKILLPGNPSNERKGCDLASPLMTKEAYESSQVTVFNAANLHVLIPEADKKQEKKSRESKKKQRSHENNSRASTKRKKLDLLSQSSKDGWADEILGMPSTLGETLISFSGIDANGEDELSNGPSQARGKRTTFNAKEVKILERGFELGTHPKPERRIELARALGLDPRQVQVWFQNRRAKLKREQLHEDHEHLQRQFEAIQTENQYLHAEAESGLETPSLQHEELPNDYQPFVDTTDKPQIAEVIKSHDNKPESELIPPLGDILSDPCLEFAFKTLTGGLPAEAPSADESFSAFAANMMFEKNLTTENMGRNIEVVVPISSKQSKTTEKLSLHHEALEFQPKAVSSPIVNKANHFASGEHLQAQQVGDKPEQQPFVSFVHWSEPSFGSAFKTLSRSTPVRSYFGQQAEPSQFQRHGFLRQQSRDASSTLSHFGLPSFYRPDSSEKQVFPQPAMSMNNQSLFAGCVNFSNCTSTGSQLPPPDVNKNLMTPPQTQKKRG